MIYKRCGRCKRRIPSGSPCPYCTARRKEEYRLYDKQSRDQEAKAFYNSSDWDSCRRYVLELDDGLDVYAYMTSGALVPADTVHHIIPRRDDPARALDPDNLMSISSASHGQIEAMYKRSKAAAIQQMQLMISQYRSQKRN